MQAHQPLDYLRTLRTLRNRIAHHEPLFARHVAADYRSILAVAGWVSPETRDRIEHHSRVEEILKAPRDADAIRF